MATTAWLVGLVVLGACSASKPARSPASLAGPSLRGEKVVVATFSTGGAIVRNFRAGADGLGAAFAEKLVEELRERSVDAVRTGGSDVPLGAMVVRGRVRLVEGGNRAKRYWAGSFGAGRAQFGVEGEVVGPDGTVVAVFRRRRSSSGAADPEGVGNEALVSRCARVVAQDVARMMVEGRYQQKDF